eukprot:TRINITY_DN5848_c1_g1_i2.p1 TRINITY_DN5848_c1_g1~~TRINITY_DN5848_c1_g1_i2.p1  ORF type:complete len:414 (+),score=66.08 TRINITY_DN5848_c1_g1_i2:31-1242(+)
MEASGRPLQLKDFTKIKLLGKGSYGSVYRVKCNWNSDIIALKEMNIKAMNTTERKTALNEVRLLASIQHPHVIEYKFSFIEDGKLYIGTELAESGDMDGLIKKCQQSRKFLDENQVWNSVAQICSGLKALHDAGIMHRDLKSSNILICDQGILKLADFGVARILKGSEYAHTNIGTPYYLSPEQWKDQPYNEKADMWSLGVVLYELVSLRLPFQGVNMNELSRNVVNGQYSRLPSHTSPELQNLINRLLVKNPKVRPSADEVLQLQNVRTRLPINHNLEIKLMDTIMLPGKMSRANIELPGPSRVPTSMAPSAPSNPRDPRPPAHGAPSAAAYGGRKAAGLRDHPDAHKENVSHNPAQHAQPPHGKDAYNRQYGNAPSNPAGAAAGRQPLAPAGNHNRGQRRG